MLKLGNLLKEVNEYEIFCDMDGVLTDFDKQLYLFTGIKGGREYEKKKGTEAFWDEIDKGGLKYWSEMPWMPDGKKLWNYIKDKNVRILSSPARTIPESSKGKRIWVKKNLGSVELLLRQAKNKQEFAKKNAILIDDMDENIKQWKAKGGIGILHKSAADTIKKLKELGVNKLKETTKQLIGKPHVVSPTLKKKKNVPTGLGSKKKVRGARKGETSAAARHRLRKGLGDGVIKLKDLIKEIFILYEDQSDELVKIARTQNGLISPKGEPYAVPAIRHLDFLVKQPKYKLFKNQLDNSFGNEYAIIYEKVIKEAMKDGWVRISGNKSEIGFTATKQTLNKHKRLMEDIVMFVESVVKRPIKVYYTEFFIR